MLIITLMYFFQSLIIVILTTITSASPAEGGRPYKMTKWLIFAVEIGEGIIFGALLLQYVFAI